MAECFAFSIAENVLEKIACLSLQNVVSAWGLESDVESINKTLLAIKAVLLDAEHKQLHNEAIKFWLKELQQVMYDAEDVLDEVECEALQRRVRKSRNTGQKVRGFLSNSNPIIFRFRIANKLKKIRERLVEIAALKSDFGLTEGISDRQVIRSEREMTHSFVNAATVIGRDEDKENIIYQLLNVADADADAENENPSVLSIVGMGGSGKTTLAKLLFNDKRISTHFEKLVWVCISEDFDLQKVLVKIIKSATKEKCTDWDVEQLQRSLRDTLSGERYLLVLDDVWNEDRGKWLELKNLLVGGASGSCVLVTTRDKHVATVMSTTSSYSLNCLSYKDCLSLFFKCAFKAKQDVERYPNLIKIGVEIVRKCKGVPLAVVTLGNMLFSITDEVEWKSVRDSELWQLEERETRILPALRISYEHLPPHLKRCFAYCSFYPKDFDYTDFDLIQFWMAYGLLQPRNGNEDFEDIGRGYLKELYSRSFFQDLEDYYGFIICKMHDLMHDLAISLMQDECLIVTSMTRQVTITARHLLFADPASLPSGISSILDSIDRVRTITPHVEYGFNNETTTGLCLTRFQHLRWLNLRDSDLEILPEDIGMLKHLRFLDLRYSNIKRLPMSLYKLQSLQTLWLRGNEIEDISTDIRFLISLRSLSITTKQKNLPRNGIGCLTSLRYLRISECDNLEYLFEDIERLTNLRTLLIEQCRSFICLPRNIIHLTALETLRVTDCENVDLGTDKDDDEDEEERNDSQHITPCGLRKLMLVGLPKLTHIPRWLLKGSSNTLQFFVLVFCFNVKELPDCLLNATSLQQLEIGGSDELIERCQPEIGKDWYKIAHIQQLVINSYNIQSADDYKEQDP